MNKVNTIMDEENSIEHSILQLATLRQQKGYSIEYVANQLRLRKEVIQCIEEGKFHLLPSAVFSKGYLRAYAKLLGIAPEPFLATFDTQYPSNKKPHRALWQQGKRQSQQTKSLIQWVTVLFAMGVFIAVIGWWKKNRDLPSVDSMREMAADVLVHPAAPHQKHSEDLSIHQLKPRLSELSKIQSLLLPKAPEMSITEPSDG